MSGGHDSERLGIRFHCCTRCDSVSRVDQCRLDSGQIERDFGVVSDVLTRKHGISDPRYFQTQKTACVNFPWLPGPEEMVVTDPSMKTVDTGLPTNGFGVPNIYVEEGDKDKDTDRLFVDGDGDYGEETCED
jgi:hypothetical protein